jgi:hypothetical protein
MSRPKASTTRGRASMRRTRAAADYETALRRGRERAVRERRVRKLQTHGMSHARELLRAVSGDANGAAAARRRTRVPLSARRGGAAAPPQSAAATVYVAPNARVVDFAVRRKPHTSTRALEVGIVDVGRRRPDRLVWLDAADVVLGRGVARRWTSETTSPLTRIRALKRALRGCVTAAFACPGPRAFDACDESERVLYGQPEDDIAGAARPEFLVCSHDAARNLTPRLPYGVVTGAGSESDWTPGEFARAAAVALRSAEVKCENSKTVAFELRCGSASVSVALAKVVDVVFAIDTRSDAARRNRKSVFVLADAHDWRESLVDVFLEPRRTWRVVFVWASPECRTYSKLCRPKYARKGAEYKEAEQSAGDVLVKLCLDFIAASRAEHWMLESCDGDLKRRSDVWDWEDEPWRLLQTSQCQFGRCDQKHTDIFMNRAMWTRASRVFPPRCARTRSPCAQLTTGRKHRLTTQDVRGSAAKAVIHSGLARAVASVLATALREAD